MARLGLFAMLGGCWTHVGGNVRGDADGVRGGTVVVEGQVAHLRAGYELGYERVHGDEDEALHGIVYNDVTVRYGMITHARGLDEPSWIDLGPAIGAGYGVSAGPDLNLHGWLGVWADLRLAPTTKYPVLRFELQRDAYAGEVRGGGQFVIGLGFVQRDEDDTKWRRH